MRTIVIGDVHGCLQELKNLIAKLDLKPGDRLIFVGDLVDRGPDSIGVIRYVKQLLAQYPGSRCVAGNHESKVLNQKEKGIFKEDWAAKAEESDWAFLDSLPLTHRIPELGVVVVHAGFYPRFFKCHPEGLEKMQHPWRKDKSKYMDRARRLLFVRYVTPEGQTVSLGQETDQDVYWTDRYDGREGYVFYGHQPYLNPPEPKLTKFTCGLDTGCCFGGKLTAAVFERDPRKAEFVSVPALAQYAKPRVEE